MNALHLRDSLTIPCHAWDGLVMFLKVVGKSAKNFVVGGDLAVELVKNISSLGSSNSESGY